MRERTIPVLRVPSRMCLVDGWISSPMSDYLAPRVALAVGDNPAVAAHWIHSPVQSQVKESPSRICQLLFVASPVSKDVQQRVSIRRHKWVSAARVPALDLQLPAEFNPKRWVVCPQFVFFGDRGDRVIWSSRAKNTWDKKSLLPRACIQNRGP